MTDREYIQIDGRTVAEAYFDFDEHSGRPYVKVVFVDGSYLLVRETSQSGGLRWSS